MYLVVIPLSFARNRRRRREEEEEERRSEEISLQWQFTGGN
jgi:hypothetical protein